jgi:hypothetical protein
MMSGSCLWRWARWRCATWDMQEYVCSGCERRCVRSQHSCTREQENNKSRLRASKHAKRARGISQHLCTASVYTPTTPAARSAVATVFERESPIERPPLDVGALLVDAGAPLSTEPFPGRARSLLRIHWHLSAEPGIVHPPLPCGPLPHRGLQPLNLLVRLGLGRGGHRSPLRRLSRNKHANHLHPSSRSRQQTADKQVCGEKKQARGAAARTHPECTKRPQRTGMYV